MRKRPFSLVGIAVALVMLAALPAAVSAKDPGFHTSEPAMLSGVGGTSVAPVISVGDTLADGYMFESIPDGISFARINGRGTADILVNHELSLVPFPATRQDASNALVSKLRLHQRGAGVLDGEFAIPARRGTPLRHGGRGRGSGAAGGGEPAAIQPRTLRPARVRRGRSHVDGLRGR